MKLRVSNMNVWDVVVPFASREAAESLARELAKDWEVELREMSPFGETVIMSLFHWVVIPFSDREIAEDAAQRIARQTGYAVEMFVATDVEQSLLTGIDEPEYGSGLDWNDRGDEPFDIDDWRDDEDLSSTEREEP
jgi:hypothetical protein